MFSTRGTELERPVGPLNLDRPTQGREVPRLEVNVAARTVALPRPRTATAPGLAGGVAVTVVQVGGELDVSTASLLRCHLDVLLSTAAAPVLVLDLDQLDFCDARGLAVFVAARQRARARGGDLHLVGTRPHLVKLFRATGLVRLLPLHPDLDTVLATQTSRRT